MAHTVSIRLTDDLAASLKARAQADDTPESEICRAALAAYLGTLAPAAPAPVPAKLCPDDRHLLHQALLYLVTIRRIVIALGNMTVGVDRFEAAARQIEQEAPERLAQLLKQTAEREQRLVQERG